MARRSITLVVVFLLVLSTVVAAAARNEEHSPKIEDGLLAVLAAGEGGRFVVEFDAEADLQGAARGNRDTRGQAVHRELVETAEASQVRARSIVDATRGASASSHWLTNVLVVDGGPDLAKRMASLPEVTMIRAPRRFPLVDPVKREVVEASSVDAPWGITKVGADQAWAQGIIGQGVVVANIDTGVDYSHEALVNQYGGNNHDGTFTHDYWWWDPTGICGDTPCDNDGHGTHTMGTIAGGDGPGPFTPDIGVAPGASWMAAKGCEFSFCSEEALLGAGEFVLAPTDLDGLNPDPSRRPDVVNNSWGSFSGDPFYTEVVAAWRAAGIVPVFSSGNPGPSCGEGGSPGDFLDSFSVGATDINDNIATFSGRGPSIFGKINPDVSAPGVDVLSSLPSGQYAEFSGTSMAAPHTAGTIALLIAAEPGTARNVDALTDTVRETALDRIDTSCGGDGDGDPNNVYGDGRVDAAAAVDLVANGGLLDGTVTDVTTTDPVAGAQVAATRDGRTYRAVTGVDGTYELFLGAGTYDVVVTAFGYESALVEDVEIITDSTTTRDVVLAPLPVADITGFVTAAEDGAPIEGAEVRAVGTPVAPAVTAGDGSYILTLPVGQYTLRTAAGGCTELDEGEVVLTVSGLTHDVALARKLDDFGHGCRRIPFDWVDAPNQSSLFGDEVLGRLTLPFGFPFYDETYSSVYISDNGYLTFERPFGNFSDPTPRSIPNTDEPNAAVYALWQNLIIDDAASVEYGTIGNAPDRAFVIELQQLRVGPQSVFDGGETAAVPDISRVDLEVKLWEDGRIDVLYGDNPANPGDGRRSTIGIENAEGTDALQFSRFEDRITPLSAYRYEVVPSGTVAGVVTDANDGLPVAGATVAATPGSRTTTTAEDGTYQLRLHPGTYDVGFSADGYEAHGVGGVVVVDAGTTPVDAILNAPIAEISPPSLAAAVDRGQQDIEQLTIENVGTAPLTWELRERDDGVTLPDLPPVPQFVRRPTWERGRYPANVERATVTALPSEALEVVVDDPDDDSFGQVELTAVRGGSDADDMTYAMDFAPSTPFDQLGGFIMFDTDQDLGTGLPPVEFSGTPEQEMGVDFFADLFDVPFSQTVYIFDVFTFDLVAAVDAVIEDGTLSFTVPLSAFGENEDGEIDTGLVVGDFFAPLDWAPDAGAGTIRAFRDAPWMASAPSQGVIDPGQQTVVDVSLGGTSLSPGAYEGELFLFTDAPRIPVQIVPVSLTVGLPAGWGAASGVVLDAHAFEPVPKALVTMTTEDDGTELVLEAEADVGGDWAIIGPPGTWPIAVTKAGYVSEVGEVTIVSGHTTDPVEVLLHARVPHAEVDDAPITLTLKPGTQTSVIRSVGNFEGHRRLFFSTGEIDLTPQGSDPGPVERLTVPDGADANALTSSSIGRESPIGARPDFVGDILDAWPTDLSLPWGVGSRPSGHVIISDPDELIDATFTQAGARIDEFDVPWADAWAADLAWDQGRGLWWQVNVGGDNGIYGLDPDDGSVQMSITGSPWSGISQRGLAYDGTTDTFYIGGWNEGVIYKVAGPSWPTPGETLHSCMPFDPNISGLGWNPAFQKLWMATNSEFDDIWLVDPVTCEVEGWVPHPDPGFNGAGLELDPTGNLWTVSQASGQAYLIDSGLPTFSDLPWLSVTPEEGSVRVGGKKNLSISVDTTGLTPGVHRARVAVVTSDPTVGVVTIPVELLVTKYQRFVNAGGATVEYPGSPPYVRDRLYQAGSFGYTNRYSRVQTTTRDIRHTSLDKVFQSQREGPSRYKFTVPKGWYEVKLMFAELEAHNEFGRVMDIQAESRLVLNNLDVAGAVGRNRAMFRTFQIPVRDGTLDIKFLRAFGDLPIVNGIQVTWIGD